MVVQWKQKEETDLQEAELEQREGHKRVVEGVTMARSVRVQACVAMEKMASMQMQRNSGGDGGVDTRIDGASIVG